ncbi:uncharacterized protein N7482_007436 [Penicillium canariense]|uniref:HMG box domain-containing protein n=1 Tax=Penicillium canariense TaxID=189055 RepID=A0A9W9HWR9_9EURO|nr:uncharacterized protein N7482_007436 [Penicillium canariense]KAJ5160432.1 hypothetical protein N7482_007436 [Penicillium canariense]
MSLQRVARTGVRHLRLGDALSYRTRVIGVQNQLRHLSLATNPRFSIPQVGLLSAINSRSFSTETTESTPKKPAQKSANKTKAKKKTKRPLTEKQKEAKEKKKRSDHIKQLKETALELPKKLPQSARSIATQYKINELKQQSPSQAQKDIFKDAVEQVQSQRLAEAERFVNQAEENRAANEASYEAWLKQYTPLQIKEANTARKALRRLGQTKFRTIQDDRLVKRPMTTFFYFLSERHGSGDFKHMAVKDVALRTADEWKSMTDSEKQPYVEKQLRDHERYVREYREVYGEEPPTPKKSVS